MLNTVGRKREISPYTSRHHDFFVFGVFFKSFKWGSCKCLNKAFHDKLIP